MRQHNSSVAKGHYCKIKSYQRKEYFQIDWRIYKRNKNRKKWENLITNWYGKSTRLSEKTISKSQVRNIFERAGIKSKYLLVDMSRNVQSTKTCECLRRKLQESRVRENRMHGLMRGGWNFHPPTLHAWLVRGRSYMPGQRHESHHKICN